MDVHDSSWFITGYEIKHPCRAKLKKVTPCYAVGSKLKPIAISIYDGIIETDSVAYEILVIMVFSCSGRI